MAGRGNGSSYGVLFKGQLKDIPGCSYFGMKGAHLFKFHPFRLIGEPQHIAFYYAT
jgi:hypothetical protein